MAITMAQTNPDHQPDRAATAPGASAAPSASSSTPQARYPTGTPALPGATGIPPMAGPPIPSGVAGSRHEAGPPASPGAAGTQHKAGATTSPGTGGAPHVAGAPTSQGAVGVDPVTAPLTYPGTPPWRPAVLVTDAAVLTLQPRHDAPMGQWLLQTDDVDASLDPISRGRLPQGTTPGDLASSDTFTGETQSRSRTTGRRDASKARADSAEAHRAMVGNAEPDDAEADSAEPESAEPHDAKTDSAGPDAAARDSADHPDLQKLPLDRYLRNAGGSPVASLVPVLAVGSNASPAQLRRKLAHAGLPTLVPITAVRVSGLAVGVSAHVSRPGYLPATPVPDDGAVSDLWLVWLDRAALAAVDATEPNYERIPLPTRYPVRLTTGQPVMRCWVYLSRHGYLINEAEEPRRLTDQATLISALLAGIPGLPALGGTSPQEWIERTHDPIARDAIREAFRSAGLVRSTAGL